MKKIQQDQWMDFTMDAMVLAKRYVCGQKPKEKATIDVSSAEVVVAAEKPEVVKVAANATPMTTLANMAVVPGSSSQSIGSYLASISGQTLTSSMYGDYTCHLGWHSWDPPAANTSKIHTACCFMGRSSLSRTIST